MSFLVYFKTSLGDIYAYLRFVYMSIVVVSEQQCSNVLVLYFTCIVLFMLMVTCAFIHSGFLVPWRVQTSNSEDF